MGRKLWVPWIMAVGEIRLLLVSKQLFVVEGHSFFPLCPCPFITIQSPPPSITSHRRWLCLFCMYSKSFWGSGAHLVSNNLQPSRLLRYHSAVLPELSREWFRTQFPQPLVCNSVALFRLAAIYTEKPNVLECRKKRKGNLHANTNQLHRHVLIPCLRSKPIVV